MPPKAGCLLALLLLAALPTPARADSSVDALHDAADLFRPETRAQALHHLERIREVYRLRVVIDTVATLSDADRARLDPKDKRNRGWFRFDPNKAFRGLAQEKAKERGLRGIYILISTDSHCKCLQVVVEPPEVLEVFTGRDAERLRRQLDRHLSANPDSALLDAIAEIERTLHANLNPQPWIDHTLLTVVGGLVGLWLLVGLVRMKLNAARPEPHAGADLGRHDLRLAAYLGGLFGTAASHWMLDSLLRQAGPVPPASTTQNTGAAPAARPTAPPGAA